MHPAVCYRANTQKNSSACQTLDSFPQRPPPPRSNDAIGRQRQKGSEVSRDSVQNAGRGGACVLCKPARSWWPQLLRGRRVDACSSARVRKTHLHARTRWDVQTSTSDLASSISANALNKSSAQTCTCNCAPLETASIAADDEPLAPATPAPASAAPAAEAAAAGAAEAAVWGGAATEASNSSRER